MKSLPNIDKSAFRPKEYVGYCNGAQRIAKRGNEWVCMGLVSAHGTPVKASARTLAKLSQILEAVDLSN